MRAILASLALALAGSAPATAPEPASVVPAAPAARVKRHAVVHAGKGVTVRVPEAAAYVGSERFALYGIADAEIHVFAEADGKRRLTRLYWIQFESPLPSRPEARYDYSDNERAELWGRTTWVRTGPRRTADPGRAGSDREHVMNILARAGYAVPAETMNARLVQILDDPSGTGKGRDELMLIYSEDLAPTGKAYDALVKDGGTTPAWDSLEAPLVARAAAAFTVERIKAGRRRR
ncbi:MAG TPA: hypothetical protein VEW26_07755 [Allosphingosinicella sp.]|nr:hypothetical protein [Allosphingosinicella sp.]